MGFIRCMTGDILFLAFILLIAIGRYVHNDSGDLNKEISGRIKGILAILILFHHLSLSYDNSGLIFPHLSTIGFLCSGCFFALSGYGVSRERERIGSFSEYVKKRLRSVVVPFLIATVVYLVYYIVFCNDHDFLTLPVRFIRGELVKYSWYVFVCIILYLVYGLIFYHDISRKNTVLFLVSVLLMVLLWIIYKEKTHWYSSIMCFWFGVVYARGDVDRHRNITPVRIIGRLFLFMVLFAVILLFYSPLTDMNLMGFLVLALLMNLTAIFLSRFLFGFFGKWDYHSPIWSFVGKISYEIYLYQGLAMGIVDRMPGAGNAGSYIVIPAVLVMTIVIAVIADRVLKLRR